MKDYDQSYPFEFFFLMAEFVQGLALAALQGFAYL